MTSADKLASMRDAKDYFSRLSDDLTEYLDPAYQKAFDRLMSTLDQYFNTIVTINMQASENHFITADEATQIGDEGLVILLKLISLMEKLDLPHKRTEIEQISLIFARWIIRFSGTLNYIEPIVNGFAQLANLLTDKKALIELSGLMSDVSDSCATEIKQDHDHENDSRPWRLLQINRGIVATRTHDLSVMQRAFDEFLMYLPEDASAFFKQGMNEMDVMKYPPHVQQLMQKYHAVQPSTVLH